MEVCVMSTLRNRSTFVFFNIVLEPQNSSVRSSHPLCSRGRQLSARQNVSRLREHVSTKADHSHGVVGRRVSPFLRRFVQALICKVFGVHILIHPRATC